MVLTFVSNPTSTNRTSQHRLRLQPRFAKARFAKGRALYFLGPLFDNASSYGTTR